ncbi:Chemotaxis response regulator protein-glutamate methylesterase CheB [Arcticibacter svalbardensis MN12-7]|uniref:protein-glutamate methylesterase n=1 Tax=Arcticibacter svalbardensis MN12-7 TaxID=1150600 RepID=R9GN32_9SPHI|nr:chemotaxis protein CheB [Arcticibacter svalbardensis]EOR92950.1 Chemotaxis response regulator protein-glutamate methylesterase CheB [Arcticibacter svalbardensis MN12-7]
MDSIKNIIVIGASAGGFKAIINLVSKIPSHLPTAVFVVLHLSKESMVEVLQHHMEKYTSLKCCVPQDMEVIKRGYVYIAPTDRHMLLKKGLIRITKGPHENRWRPSIDVLFRSAAVSYNSHVVGIVLTGMLYDGTAGMSAIKRSGGITIVQEPSEAEFPDMPTSVINNVPVDYRVHIGDIGYILDDIFSKSIHNKQIPEDVLIEAEITEKMVSSIDALEKIAQQSIYACPQCGGGLWKINNDPTHRYRCHTGHTFNEKVLLESQAESVEESIWVSVRMLEERKKLLRTIAEHDHESGDTELETINTARADMIETHITRLKLAVVALHSDGTIAQDDVA